MLESEHALGHKIPEDPHHAGEENAPRVPSIAVKMRRANGERPRKAVSRASPSVTTKNRDLDRAAPSVGPSHRRRPRTGGRKTTPGRAKATGTAATRDGTWVSCAMTKPASTASIHTPTFETRAVDQSSRNGRIASGLSLLESCRSEPLDRGPGASTEASAGSSSGSGLATIIEFRHSNEHL